MSELDILADESDGSAEELSEDLIKGSGLLAARIIVAELGDQAKGGVGGEEGCDTFNIFAGLEDTRKDGLKLPDLESWVTFTAAALRLVVVVTLLPAWLAALSLGDCRSDEQQGKGSEKFQQHTFAW